MKNTLKTLDFQGQPLYYLTDAAGTNLVLIRPLCDLLGVDAERQIKNLQDDEILAPERSEQTVQVPGHGQARTWICLPERFIYGWVFGIQFTNTMRPETKANLSAYKRDCYNALYDHFHGRLRHAQELDKEAAIIDLELEAVEKRLQRKLQADPDHLRKLELEAKRKQVQRAQREGRKVSRQTAFEFALGVVEPGEE